MEAPLLWSWPRGKENSFRSSTSVSGYERRQPQANNFNSGKSIRLPHSLNLSARFVNFPNGRVPENRKSRSDRELGGNWHHDLWVVFSLLSAIWSNETKLIVNVKNMCLGSWRPLMNFRSFINFIIGWVFHWFYTNDISHVICRVLLKHSYCLADPIEGNSLPARTEMTARYISYSIDGLLGLNTTPRAKPDQVNEETSDIGSNESGSVRFECFSSLNMKSLRRLFVWHEPNKLTRLGCVLEHSVRTFGHSTFNGVVISGGVLSLLTKACCLSIFCHCSYCSLNLKTLCAEPLVKTRIGRLKVH